ncbi:MAG: hypothetical protein U5L73_15980 [Rhodoferax sp.]|uniref:hypothetical protein n=1 Tax=Rhodoferax sp. TaxID=50421 RepID=UPI002ACE697C|nr:hypothetical protein [Rhodoferax sp.]MDZ7893238.1 hypothetical protein [Rhodoferax sp.]
MNTIDFDENRYFCEHLTKLLAEGDYETFQCLLADHGHTLTDFVNLTINALMPPPDLTGYFLSVRTFINTGELK